MPDALASPATVIEEARLDRVPFLSTSDHDSAIRAGDSNHNFIEIDLSLVTYNSQRWIEGFFTSLAAQGYPLGKIHLYVIDHSPDEACLKALRQVLEAHQPHFASVHLEQRPNRGFGAGHNRALALGKSPFVLVSNVDLTFEPDTLIQLIGAVLSDPPAVVSWECRQKPYEHSKVYDILTQTTEWSSSACVLLRRMAWQAVGGYDERFFMYGEDVDLSWRLRDQGGILRYCPKAVVWHYAYEEPAVVKETQYFGATLANMYLRLRFGGVIDILLGLAMQAALLVHKQPFPGKLRKLFANYRQIISNAPYFLATHAKLSGIFFNRWDFGERREGAFVELEPLQELAALVTLIVRTYPGRLPLLQQALHSIELQTYRPLEIIVVEDGGDTTRDYVTTLRHSTDLNIVHYAAPKRGRSHAGNLGLTLASGDLIGFLDDDDLLYADHVEVLVGSLARQAGYQAAYTHAWEVETTFTPGAWLPYHEGYRANRMPDHFDRARLTRANFIPIQTMLFRRTLYETYGGFYEGMENLEDWDLWQRYALAGDFLYVPKTTSLYRTPADPAVRLKRAMELTAHYHQAIARQQQMVLVEGGTVAELRERAFPGVTYKFVDRRQLILGWLVSHPVFYRFIRKLWRLFRAVCD